MAHARFNSFCGSLLFCLSLVSGAAGARASVLEQTPGAVPPAGPDPGPGEAPLLSTQPQSKPINLGSSQLTSKIKDVPVAGPKRIITRAVGEVGDHVVTSREVMISDAVGRALESKGPLEKEAEVLTGDEKTFPSEVSKLLDIWIVYLEAKSLSAHALTRQDVARGVRTVQDRWAGNQKWLQLEASPDELRDEVERQLLVHEFVAIKSDPSLAPVSDEDALTYYNQNRLKYGSLPFAELRENIKSSLAKQQTERRMAEWRDVLRRKYKVRNFIAG